MRLLSAQNIKGYLVFVLLLVAAFAFSSSVLAQGNGFQLSPPTVELEADPGDIIEVDGDEAISIRNITSERLRAEAEFNDFLPQDETGSPTIITDNIDIDPGEFGMRDWFDPVEPFELDPNERTTVPVTIRVPENAAPGGHYGVVRFTALAPGGNSAVALSASVGTLFLVNVSGEVQEDIDLLEAGVSQNGEDGTFFQSSPDTFFTRFQNVGNTHTKPFGVIQIKNLLGNVVHEFEINSGRGNVLPDSIRRYETELPSDFNLGRYTVSGALAYGNGNGDIMEVDFNFWVVPVWLLVTVFVGLPATYFIGKVILGRYNERVIAKSRRRK